ncbi:hypothetical protein QFC21_003477 [Naganishia friedmannii]|uniref:Uncharacterized protein n=1 Tax=Naganishia friedmannii TaxID=89922 RepID=A0ACC2VPD6_9TREE|nr:hypothetical protein QFC21_003477 [Naganishia friedmannii]
MSEDEIQEVKRDGDTERPPAEGLNEMSRIVSLYTPIGKAKDRKGKTYASKAGKQSTRTERRKPESNIPASLPRTLPSTSQTPEIHEIDDSEDDIICFSPEKPSPQPVSIREESETEAENEYEIISAWLVERDGEVASEELLMVLDEHEEEDENDTAEDDADKDGDDNEEGEDEDTGLESADRINQEDRADNIEVEAALPPLMLHNPAEDALIELDDHESENTPTDHPAISVAQALEILHPLLESGKKHSHLDSAHVPPLLMLRNFFIQPQKG